MTNHFPEKPPHRVLLPNIHGVLLDLDGVLYIGEQRIDGAVEALACLAQSGLQRRFITNTSTQSRSSLCAKLRRMGFEVNPAEIFSAPQAAYSQILHDTPDAACHFLLTENVREDFTGLREVSLEEAEVIVLGDIGPAWTYELLNRIFNRLMNGASLIAVHKNRFWQTETGLRMDIGGFVQALEYCSGVVAKEMGKPSRAFFLSAVVDMGLSPREVAVVGDDIDSDIGGAQQAGMWGVLVRTGKFRQEYINVSTVLPHWVIDSIGDLPELLGLEAR
jgi:HAD superfamily hydrolase (TIGR01458 family)